MTDQSEIHSKAVALGDRKRMNITSFKQHMYIHFFDPSKNKSMTFTLDEMKCLHTKMDKILAFMRKGEKSLSSTESTKPKKAKGVKRRRTSSPDLTPYDDDEDDIVPTENDDF